MAFKKDSKIKSNFTKITIGLASPEEILESSFGEVTKPETINYRTYKPERDGLFCERIFGPTKDYECACGKYKRIRYKGIVCDRCGVEVTEKKVRRERTGHIELVVPVAHIWYFRSLPNKIGYLLGMPTKKLDAIIYYERYVVIQPGPLAGKKDADGNPLLGSQAYDLLSEDEYNDLLDNYISPENEYLEELRFALEGGSITPRERRFLNKIRSLLGISEARGAELESSLKKRRLFVSYSRSDKEKVMDFLQLIERETGESCWMDLTGIESGSQFEETIIKAIDDSEIVLFMMSDNSVASPWTKREVYYAESEGKKIVPISLDGKGMRGWFKFHFAHIDCIDSSSRDQVKKLISNIKSWLS